MKIFGNLLFCFFILLVSVNLYLASINYNHLKHRNALANIISPLPQLLSNTFSREAHAQVFWQPDLRLSNSSQKELPLTARAAIAYDTTSETMLFTKNIDTKLPIASLTKIMTAVIALENFDLNEEITVTRSASEIGEGSMGLAYGERYNVEDLLYGLILKSGNDAGEAIAQGSRFKRDGFIHLMNKKAEDLGLSHTRFTNPTGLQGDGEQYSTPKELLVLTRYALQKEKFAKIAATYEYGVAANSTHGALTLLNETNLLTSYPGVEGVKTGYTDEAGMCLITFLNYKGHKIITILLNSQNRRAEMMQLLDYSLKNLNIQPPPHG